MTKKNYIIIASIVATFAVFTAWLGSNVRKIPGLANADPFVVQALVMVIGIIAAGVATFIMTRGADKKSGDSGGGGAAAAEAEVTDMDELLGECEARLAVAQQEKDSKLGKLPVVILLGEPGSAKTTTMVQSGTEPESLAGQVYEENNILPTPAANFWFAHHTVFVEMGGKLLGDTDAWKRLVGRLQPPKAAALLGTAQPVPRAALVCVDAEVLLSPSPDPLAVTARKLRAQLAETAHLLGINLPVYVLFTRGDRLPFFTEYFNKLNNEEATRILGCTLPVVTEHKGIYAEQESSRLGAAFEKLFRKMCQARPIFLARESEPLSLGAMYEFPREFRKIHQEVVRFLVELCRPSQITVAPFLRGFYFSGVRPIMVNEVAPAAPMAPAGFGGQSGATSMFRAPGAAAGGQRIVGQRKVPQWLFLSHLFNDQMLADTAAKDASSSSVRASASRRILLTAASLLCLIYCVVLLFSFRHNRDLADNVKTAAQALAATPIPSGEAPSVDSLKKLDTLRLAIRDLGNYNRNGAPLGYKWGLYIGKDLYDPAYKLYFDNFCRVLLQPTKDTITASLNGLPGSAPENDKFGGPYKSLKAYLEVTLNPEHATTDFLPQALLERWGTARNVDPDRMALAQTQFDYYTDELIYDTQNKLPNPCGSANDAAGIGSARAYLGGFDAEQRVYQAMLADAAKAGGKPIVFNERFPGSAEEVLDNYPVKPEFTKKGWDFFAAALRNPKKYFEGEAWVLGPQSKAIGDISDIAKRVADHYHGDYMKEWRTYMQRASVVHYTNLTDASKKLIAFSGNRSPIMELFWLAALNTNVDDPNMKTVFQPVIYLEPSQNEVFTGGDTNQKYIDALGALQVSIDRFAQQPANNDAGRNQTQTDAGNAHAVVRATAGRFTPDPVETSSDKAMDQIVQKLMHDPITQAEAWVKSAVPAALNAAGAGFCSEYQKMFSKYPFNRLSKTEATVDDVNTIFKKPDGKFWKFYNENLSKLMPAPDYSPVTVDGVSVTSGFNAWFKRTAGFGDSLYVGNTPDPHFTYTLKSVAGDGITGVKANLDGQDFSYSGTTMTTKQLTWQGSGTHGVKATYDRGGDNGWRTEDGLWSIFHFFYAADNEVPASGGGYTLEWIIRSGNPPQPTGNVVRIQVDIPMFRKDFLSGLRCDATVAKQ